MIKFQYIKLLNTIVIEKKSKLNFKILLPIKPKSIY